MLNPKNSCRPVKIVWPPAHDPHQKVLSVSKRRKLLHNDLSNSRFKNIIAEHETIGASSLDYDKRDYLVHVQKGCMRSIILNKEMTIHRFFSVP
jgi:hypothetical protein